jgi:hypothetical protein
VSHKYAPSLTIDALRLLRATHISSLPACRTLTRFELMPRRDGLISPVVSPTTPRFATSGDAAATSELERRQLTMAATPLVTASRYGAFTALMLRPRDEDTSAPAIDCD